MATQEVKVEGSCRTVVRGRTLLGRMFGGKVAEIMGGAVARDEKSTLSAVFPKG